MLFNLLAETKPVDWTSYLMIGVLIIAIIGLFVWSSYSNKKKQKDAQNVINNLKVGDRVKTIGGICGFVAEINDAENTFVLKTGMDGHDSFVKFDKGAIYQTAPGNVEKVAPAPAEEKPAPKKRAPRAKKPAEPVVEAPAEEKPADAE